MPSEPMLLLRDEAVRWHVRIADGSAADWEAFTVWLGSSPAHAAAYDAVEQADMEAGPALLEALETAPVAEVQAPVNDTTANDTPANDNGPWRVRRWWMGGAAAASIALAAVIGPGMIDTADPYEMATAPGQTRIITLESGDRIALNGGSRIGLDHKNPRFASLEQGEATFTIRHNPAAPFLLHVGDNSVQDVGTVFNVARYTDGVQVDVAQGAILYNPTAEAVKVGAGESLRDPGGSGTIIRRKVDPGTVGSWRAGRLNYSDAALTRVTADLTRAIGEPVSLDPALANRRFTGTVHIDADHARLFSDLAVLLGVRAARRGDGWTLLAPNSAAR